MTTAPTSPPRATRSPTTRSSIVGSAPCYPYGTVDPIPALAALAQERGICCHVDACVGGFLLPFLPRLGYEVPPWDFSVPGVTSISADLHKYGYSARGASTVMYRSKELRRYQFFSYADWPGGLYGSPTMAGSRPGGAIAAAWAVMNYLGEEGYTRLVGSSMETARELMDGVNAIPGLQRAWASRTPASSLSRPIRSTSSPWATRWTTAAGTWTASRCRRSSTW